LAQTFTKRFTLTFVKRTFSTVYQRCLNFQNKRSVNVQ